MFVLGSRLAAIGSAVIFISLKREVVLGSGVWWQCRECRERDTGAQSAQGFPRLSRIGASTSPVRMTNPPDTDDEEAEEDTCEIGDDLVVNLIS